MRRIIPRMTWVFFAFFFVLGLIVGSFLNVVVLRYGARSLAGRSQCGACGKLLRWFELIPLASFFLQGRRCRSCKGRISWQYPLVELITGLVFALVFWKYASSLSLLPLFSYRYLLLVIQLALWSLLIALSVYDLRHKIIPDGLVYGFVALSFLVFLSRLYAQGPYPLWQWDIFGSALLSAPLAALWFFSRGRAFGLGDAKLVFGFSPVLGLMPALSALLLGFWLGALAALGALLLKSAAGLAPRGVLPGLNARLKGLTMKSELPLAPFLVFGLLIVYLTGVDVTGLSLLLQSN